MITAMFNIRSYNDQVFELIIRRIHAFTQELNLFNALCGECVPALRKKIWNAYEKNLVYFYSYFIDVVFIIFRLYTAIK